MILASFCANLSTLDAKNTLLPHENGALPLPCLRLARERAEPGQTDLVMANIFSCRRALCDRCANALIATRQGRPLIAIERAEPLEEL